MHATPGPRSPKSGRFAPVFSVRPGAVAALLAVVTTLSAGKAFARIEGEAVIGQPFGVGQITLSGEDAPRDGEELHLRIEERDGRIHYPAFTKGVAGRVIGQILGDPELLGPGQTTIHFLFDGDRPLRVTLYSPQPREFVLTPREPASDPRPARPRPRFRLRMRGEGPQLARWWREYSLDARRQIDAGDHPPLVHDYLTTMLAMRLGLEPPRALDMSQSEGRQSIELLAGVEKLRRQTLMATMRGEGDFDAAADEPLPPAPQWGAPEFPALAEENIDIEPLAMHVPAACFYIRFGRFNNYLWLNRLLSDYGGDLASMVTLRAYFPSVNDRVQNQLGLEQSQLAELFGERVIADVCLLGRDTFVRDGAAIGILFQARNSGVLGQDLTQQRRRALARLKADGAKEETVDIGGRKVSLVSTPDNRLRSFHAVDGDFHLVTTSGAIVERFFAAGRGEGSLGGSQEFRRARARMPTSREDTVFIYMSMAFFQGLLSPQYQIELSRRLEAVTDIELLMLARLAAGGEGQPDHSIEDLIAGGFLPEGFGRRSDGSEPIVEDGRTLNSLRGARGTFLPIADVKFAGVTAREAERYAALAKAYERSWEHLDPLAVAVKRYAVDQSGRERVTIDGEIAPLDESKYGWVLSILGEPTRQMITPASGDVINVQAAVRGGVLSPQIPPHHLFLGVQDIPPEGTGLPRGFLETFQLIRGTPGYLGGWPRPGFLDLLPLGLAGEPPDEFGFSALPLGLWKREGNGMSVLSFDPQLLADVTPELRIAEAEQEVQLRIHVGDLSQAKIGPWINRTYYQRAVEATEGNIQFLHDLNQQLGVPLADCREVAEELLEAELSSPLGGDYELAGDGDASYWRATAAAARGDEPPADYQAPLLAWFRGLDASLVKYDDRMLAHLEIDMQRKAAEPQIELPLLDLFRGAARAFAPQKQEDAAEELPPPLPPVPEDARPRPREE